MTATPNVELRFNPTDLRPRDLPKTGEFLGKPSDAIEAALTAARLRMIEEMRDEVRGLAEPTHAQLLRAADVAWQVVFWRYRKISAPVMADAYIRAYRAAGAGDVPMSVIYDLADKHAEKIGDYFQSSSRDALAEGFNTLVNRRVPAKAAADKVLDAYGLTPRQMRGFTSNKQFAVPVESISPFDVKARARAYIDRSFTQRVRKLARQEEHNIDQQAQQFAWMWMQDKGKLSPKAQKLWITAKDERVCPVCGPLHGKKVGLNDQFVTPHGQFWTPGLHPNCRCQIRLIENRFSKAVDWDPKEHPRGVHGRFSHLPRTKTIDVDTEFAQITKPQPATAVERSTDTELDQLFQSVVSSAIKPQTTARPAITAGKVSVAGATPKTKPQVQTARPQVVSPKVAVANQIAAQVASPKVMTEFTTKVATQLKAQTKPDTSVKIIAEAKTAPQQTGTTVYHVTTGGQFDPTHIKNIKLNRAMEFTTSPEIAAEQASAQIREAVIETVQRVMQSGAEFTSARSGTEYRLDRDEVGKLVEFYARDAQLWALDPNKIEETEVPMLKARAIDIHGRPLLDEMGQPVVEHFSAGYVGRELDIPTHPFDVKIVAVNEGFQDKSYPEFMSDDPDVPDQWTFEGTFRVKPGSVKYTDDKKFNALIMEVEPVRDQPKKHD